MPHTRATVETTENALTIDFVDLSIEIYEDGGVYARSESAMDVISVFSSLTRDQMIDIREWLNRTIGD